MLFVSSVSMKKSGFNAALNWYGRLSITVRCLSIEARQGFAFQDEGATRLHDNLMLIFSGLHCVNAVKEVCNF